MMTVVGFTGREGNMEENMGEEEKLLDAGRRNEKAAGMWMENKDGRGEETCGRSR